MTGSPRTSRPEGALLAPVRDEARSLDRGVQLAMERALGSPFGDVVVHAGPASSATADDLDAAAFTVGRHIVFGAGRYDPGSLRGRQLLAHELTHVVQQRRGGGDPDAGENVPAAGLPVHSGPTEARAAASGRGEPAGDAGTAGVGIARQSKTAEAATKDDARPSTEQLTRELRGGIERLGGYTAIARNAHRDYLNQWRVESAGDIWDRPSRLSAVAANLVAGVTPPTLGLWDRPLRDVAEARAALDRGDLRAAALELKTAAKNYEAAKTTWNAYIEASIGGVEKVIKKIRGTGRAALGFTEGVVTEVTGLADTVLWAVEKQNQLKNAAIDTVGDAVGLSKETRSTLKNVTSGSYGLVKRGAASLGAMDPSNGAIALTRSVNKSFDKVDDEVMTQGMTDDQLFFDERDITQLVGSGCAQVVGAWIGAKEVQITLKVVSMAGVAKAIWDIADQHRRPEGGYDLRELANDPELAFAVGNAALSLAGLASMRVGSKMLRILAAIGPAIVASSKEIARLTAAVSLPSGPKRDQEIEQAGMALAHVLVNEIVSHGMRRASSSKAPKPQGGANGGSGGAAPVAAEPITPKSAAPGQPSPAPASRTSTPEAQSPKPPTTKLAPIAAPALEQVPVAAKAPVAEPVVAKAPVAEPVVAKAPVAEPVSSAAKAAGDVAAPTTKPAPEPTLAGKPPTTAEPAVQPAAGAPETTPKPAPESSPAATAEPKLTPSRAKTKAEAGERMRHRAEQRLVDAIDAEAQAGATLTIAEQRKATVEAEIKARELAGRKVTKALENERRIAGDKLAAAKQALAAAQTAKAEATEGLAKATQEAAERSQDYEDAKQQAALKKAAQGEAKPSAEPAPKADSATSGEPAAPAPANKPAPTPEEHAQLGRRLLREASVAFEQAKVDHREAKQRLTEARQQQAFVEESIQSSKATAPTPDQAKGLAFARKELKSAEAELAKAEKARQTAQRGLDEAKVESDRRDQAQREAVKQEHAAQAQQPPKPPPELVEQPSSPATKKPLPDLVPTSGEGLITKVVQKPDTNGAMSTRIEGALSLPSTKGRSGFEKLVKTVLGLHRAHLWTWRFGEEAAAGIMNASLEVNLSIQKKLENRIVEFTEASLKQGNQPKMQVIGVSKPGEHHVLDHAVYSVWETRPDGTVHGFKVTIDAEGVVSGHWIDKAPEGLQ